MRIQSLLTARTGIITSVLALLLSLAQAQTVYVENFDTAPSSTTADSVSIGGDADAGGPPAAVVLGKWGLSGNGSLGGGLVQPQGTAAGNARLAGVFLDFLAAGAGTYVLEFDVIPDVAGTSDNAFVYVYQGSGYSEPPVDDPAGTDFLVLDTTNAGFGGGSFEPVTALGGATVSRVAITNFDDTSILRANEKLYFTYDGTSTVAIVFGAYDSTVGFDNLSIYKVPTYTTDFEGFTSGINNDYLKDFNVAYGSSDGGASVLNTKFLNETLTQWGITANGNDFADGVVRPQNSPATLGEGNNANNVKMAGLFLDPVLFSGAGDYTITFDITGDPLGNATYRAYVFEGSGYDFDENGDDYLSLSLSSDGFDGDPGYTGLTAAGTGTASELVMQDISELAVDPATNTVSITFSYDGSSAIAFAVGGYNNASVVDNFSIAPYEAPTYTIYGTGFESFSGGIGVLNEFQGGVGTYEYDGTSTPGKVLKHLNPQWGSFRGAIAFPGSVLQPQVNTAANWRLACIFLSPEYFHMGSGTYTVSFDLTGDPAGNAAYRAYIWKGSGTNGSTAYLSMDVNDPGHGVLTGAGGATASLLVDQDISYQSTLSGTVRVAIDFTYTAGDTICFAVGGFMNSATIDNLTVSTTIAPPGVVMYATDFSSFTIASEQDPLGEYKKDFNVIFGSDVPINIVGAAVDGSGDFILDFEGFPSTSEIYQVIGSTDLTSFSPLTTELVATTDGSGAGQAVIPASEVGPVQFFRIDDQWNAKLVDSAVWGITGNGNDFADGVARPQKNPATNVKMMGVFLDPSVFTFGPGVYSVSFELTGDPDGGSYRVYACEGEGYNLDGTNAGRLKLSLSADGFTGYQGLSGVEGALVNSEINSDTNAALFSFGNATNLNNAARLSATRRLSFEFNYDGTSAVAFTIGGYNNASMIDNFFVTVVP